MNIPQIILGIVMIGIGLLLFIRQIKSFKNGEKDRWGYGRSLLITGIGFIVGGIIVIVKSV
jgi:hypothetical protein